MSILSLLFVASAGTVTRPMVSLVGPCSLGGGAKIDMNKVSCHFDRNFRNNFFREGAQPIEKQMSVS